MEYDAQIWRELAAAHAVEARIAKDAGNMAEALRQLRAQREAHKVAREYDTAAEVRRAAFNAAYPIAG